LMVRCPPSPFETLASLVPQDEGGPRTTPPPQHEGGESAAQRNAFTIARAGRRAKPGLWLFPVFVLFRPVIGGKTSRPKKRRRRVFPLLIRWLRGNTKRQVVPGRLFFSFYLQGNTGAAGPRASPSHVADAAVHHYLYAVSAGRA